MNAKKSDLFEWLFIIALIIPVVILGKMRMHQQNLAQFLILSLICITAVMMGYYGYRKRFGDYCAADDVEKAEKN